MLSNAPWLPCQRRTTGPFDKDPEGLPSKRVRQPRVPKRSVIVNKSLKKVYL